MDAQAVSLAIPASLVSDTPHLREKTLKIGMVGRAAALFGVDEIIIFPDAPKTSDFREAALISLLLSYMETPQYLRKRLFRIRPELRYAGILPPLRTPHHPLASKVKDLVDGEVREGVVVSHTSEGTIIDVGVERHAVLRNNRIPTNKRLTVKMRKTAKGLEAEPAERSEITKYWGYQVTSLQRTLGEFLETRLFDLVIATSKYGRSFPAAGPQLMKRWAASSKILVAFGAPTRGLYEILKQENLHLEDIVDFVINAIPHQQTETVRTEEAIFITLGLLNGTIAKG
jgi:predicted SPOUT superfamily RNA methylase MTH1